MTAGYRPAPAVEVRTAVQVHPQAEVLVTPFPAFGRVLVHFDDRTSVELPVRTLDQLLAKLQAGRLVLAEFEHAHPAVAS